MMDAVEIANFLAAELFMNQLVSYDGMHSGVPTRTTATLTPTTLKNIEQTFIELTSDPPTSVPHQAGFVPPFAPLPNLYADDDNSSDDSDANSVTSSNSWHTTPPPAMINDDMITSNNNNNNSTGKKRKNMGGRRPNKPSNLSPEEEEKRRVRRERNKLAAARCRRRREDHTTMLLDETEGLERKKQSLQTEYQTLQQKKEELEFLLESHRALCRMGGAGHRSNSPLDVKPQIPNILLPAEKIKSEPLDQFDDDDIEPKAKRVMLSQSADLTTPTSLPSIINLQHHNLNNQRQHPQSQKVLNQPQMSSQPIQNHKPPRPSSLKVPFHITPSDMIAAAANKTVHEYAGVAITTPSSGSFNFDSLMEGGTGLTPTVTGPFPLPNNNFQNRNPLDLVTPTSEPSRFVSL